MRFEFEPTGKPDIAKGKGAPGRAQLYINGKLAGQADFPVTIPLAIGIGGGLAVGRNPGAPVSGLYHPPFAFTGKIFKVIADVSGKMIQDRGGRTEGAGEGNDGAAIRSQERIG
ncbi:MAG: hypothetical protein MPW14_03050 [Candidatus Manganitrophus sp.]|nr:MAG: hypothetical protein MPW14_03050 [Candidatus Manganitrophus sp.]